MARDEQDNAGVVVPPPLVYLGFLSGGLLLNRVRPVRFLPRSAPRPIGWPLVAGGLLLMSWFFRTMRKAGTPIDPRQPVSRLTQEGPFRYSRNPSYVSMAAIYAGISSLANALWAILLLPAALLVIRNGVIKREERYLERTFGEEYLRYKARVRRWI